MAKFLNTDGGFINLDQVTYIDNFEMVSSLDTTPPEKWRSKARFHFVGDTHIDGTYLNSDLDALTIENASPAEEDWR